MRTATTALVVLLALPVLAMLAFAAPEESDRRTSGRRPKPADQAERAERQRPDGRRPGMYSPSPLMQALDADKNGELSAQEIANASTALKALDKNTDGKLDRTELRRQRQGAGEGIFRLDANKDGKITKDELPERMQAMFDRLDLNKDGAIDKDEAKKLAERRGTGRPRRGEDGNKGDDKERPRRNRRPGNDDAE